MLTVLHAAKPQRPLILNQDERLFSLIYIVFCLSSSDGRVELLGGGSLQISNLTEEDAGVYTCMADNANTSIEAQALLTIQGTLNNPHRLLSLVGTGAVHCTDC